MKISVPVYEAKAKLSKLLERALAGEVVIITKGNKPVVRLVPVESSPSREFGSMKGRARTGAEFFEELSEEELSDWE